MKSVFVIPIEPGKRENQRRTQRRMSVPRRVGAVRRESRPAEPGQSEDRRVPGDRRRLPDRRLGLKIDLEKIDRDLSELDTAE